MGTYSRALLLALLSLGVAAGPADAAATFTVTSTDDSGAGTLRQAILDANVDSVGDTIEFDIAGAGVHKITLASALPEITQPVTIDGYTQTDAAPNTNAGWANAFAAGGAGSNAVLKIEIDLNDKPGIVVSSGNTTIRGLAIYGVQERVLGPPAVFSQAIQLRTGNGDTVAGNFIGLTAGGTPPADYTDLNKQAGVGVISGDNHTIGGTAAAARNVISGNGGANGAGGIHVEGGGGTKIQGNLIGTTPNGSDIPTILDGNGDPFDLNNGQRGGIEVLGFNPGTFAITNLTIGGTEPGAGNLVSGNLHDGNSGAINIFGGWTTPEVHILANRVGTDVTGTAALGNNTGAGIYALGTTEIGDDAGHGNLISGNGLIGIRMDGEGHTIEGNRIGTNAAGTGALPNLHGISTRAEDTLIGGTTPGARNVISGNTQDGITGDTYNNNDIQGNYIGTNALGSGPIANGFAGIVLPGGTGNTIGGAAAGSDNVISGNGEVGVLLTHPGEGSSATLNEVIGNKIGTNAAGDAAVANGGPGIQSHIAGRNVLGRPSEGNTIAHNTGDGVLISGLPGQFGSDVFETNRNSIRGNSIFSNGQLGIDLGEDNDDPFDDGDGVTPNDASDQDIGNNDLQNFPLVNAALPGASTFVRGFIGTTPNRTYTIDLYRNASCDPSGNGEGGKWIGSASASTNSSGRALWSTTVTETVPLGEFVTATATDPLGNTSEFSACRESGTQVADQAIEDPVEQKQEEPPPAQPQPQPTVPQQQGTQQQPPPADPCKDKKPPITTLKRAGVKQTERGTKLALDGRSADHRDCPSGLARVDVSLARVKGRTGTNCRFLKTPSRYSLTRPQNCRRPVLFKATGTDKWTYTFPVRLKPGLYRVQARATDKAKNKETPKKNRNIVFFEVK